MPLGFALSTSRRRSQSHEKGCQRHAKRVAYAFGPVMYSILFSSIHLCLFLYRYVFSFHRFSNRNDSKEISLHKGQPNIVTDNNRLHI